MLWNDSLKWFTEIAHVITMMTWAKVLTNSVEWNPQNQPAQESHAWDCSKAMSAQGCSLSLNTIMLSGFIENNHSPPIINTSIILQAKSSFHGISLCYVTICKCLELMKNSLTPHPQMTDDEGSPKNSLHWRKVDRIIRGSVIWLP